MDHEVHKWEVSRDGIVLREVIGSRALGKVRQGILKEAGGGHERTHWFPLVFVMTYHYLKLNVFSDVCQNN